MSGSSLVVRAPNHLGDLVMALPALATAAADAVVVPRSLAPVLDLAELPGRTVPLDRGTAGLLRAAWKLRPERYGRGVLLTPSFSSALLFHLAGVGRRRGTPTDGRRLLLSDTVPLNRLEGIHRVAAYHILVTGREPESLQAPSLPVRADLRQRFRQTWKLGNGVLVGVFPGSNARSRRWPPDRFAAVVRTLADGERKVLVFGGPAEQEITQAVAGDRGLDLGGRTDLPALAAGLAECQILVTNDSGPMHLAMAVGTPTVSLLGAADPVATGPIDGPHRVVRRAELPCVPCVKNVCPRHGPGFILPRAENECLQLIQVPEVLSAVRQMAP